MNRAADRRRTVQERDRLRQLEVFSHVARLGSLSRAAKRLGITQPAVSLQIRELENELRTSLMDRGTSGISLTVAGERFYKRVKPLMERMGMLFEDRAELIHEQVTGWLDLAANPVGATNVLPRYAKQLRDLHPGVRLRVHKCVQSKGLSMLHANDVELALGVPDSGQDNSLEYREILTYKVVLITSQDHPLAGRKRVSLQEAASWPAIVPPPGTANRRMAEAAARRFGIRIRAVIEVGGWDALKRFVELGIGVAAVPSICIRETDKVSVVPVEEYLESRSFGVFTRRGDYLTAPARRILGLMIPDS